MIMSRNSNLHRAKKERNDEFFTLYEDIEKEMVHYKQHFNGKTVYCNCDDARESNFFKYFSKNFEFLGLKKLITTGYKADGQGVVLIYEGDKNGNRLPDTEEITIRPLQGNGDFRSEECIEFLKESDIVVTNSPFSLFREYIAQLMEYGKKFIIIGNGNAVTYKEIFPLIKENKLWLGNKNFSGGMDFVAGENYDSAKCKHPKYDEKGNIIINVMMCVWFTNLEHDKRHRPIDLYKHYSNECYPHYENYDAIEVSKVCDIPMDYDGVMGVPITFLDKYCPEQFEIVSASDFCCDDIKGWKGVSEEFYKMYYEQGNKGQISVGWSLPHYVENNKAVIPYKRIFIKHK